MAWPGPGRAGSLQEDRVGQGQQGWRRPNQEPWVLRAGVWVHPEVSWKRAEAKQTTRTCS